MTMTQNHQSASLVLTAFVTGIAVGIYLTRRSTKKRKRYQCLSLEHAEACRDTLPSTIILCRHGESEGNTDETLYRSKPDNLVGLTELGLRQALKAGKRIKNIIKDDNTVYVSISPSERSLQTSRNLRKAFESQIVHTSVEPRIREQEFANLQGDDFKKLREEQKKVGRFFFRFPTGESGADVYDRVKSWWSDTILNVNRRVGYAPIDIVVVVTHGLTMRFVLMQLYGWSPNTFHSVWNAGNCDLYVLRKDLTRPGRSPYVLDSKAGDAPWSSIDLLIELQKTGEKRTVTLQDYLKIPPPRTTQINLVKEEIAKQNPDINAGDIISINFKPHLN